jgi:hypothetical protein
MTIKSSCFVIVADHTVMSLLVMSTPPHPAWLKNTPLFRELTAKGIVIFCCHEKRSGHGGFGCE